MKVTSRIGNTSGKSNNIRTTLEMLLDVERTVDKQINFYTLIKQEDTGEAKKMLKSIKKSLQDENRKVKLAKEKKEEEALLQKKQEEKDKKVVIKNVRIQMKTQTKKKVEKKV